MPAEEPDWPEHESLAGELAAAVPPLSARADLYPGEHEAEVSAWVARACGAPPQVVRSLVLLLVRRAAEEGGWNQDATSRMRRVAGRGRLRLDGRDAAYLLRAAAGLPDTWAASDVVACVTAWSAQAGPVGDPLMARAAAETAESVRRREYVPARDRAAIMEALGRLRGAPRRGAPLDLALIEPGDGWSTVVLAGLADWDGAARPANLLLHHLSSACPAHQARVSWPARGPGRAWLDAVSGLVADPDAGRLLRLLLEAAAPGAAAVRDGAGPVACAIAGRNAGLLCAAAWAAAGSGADWAVPVLAAVARRECSDRVPAGPRRVPAACVAALGLIASDAALAELRLLFASARDGGFRAQVGAALVKAGRRAGLGKDEVAERAVPRAGLADGGARLIASGGAAARITITGDGAVITAWQGRAGWSGRVPAGAGPAARQLTRAAAREVGDVLGGELRRLDGLLGQDRQWPAGLWSELYLEHPVTGPLARRLIWVFDPGDGRLLTGLPEPDGTLITLDGTDSRPAEGTVRLWHPVRAGPAEVAAWRSLLAAAALRQPVAQAHRETYAPSDEDLTATRSDRLAGRLLRYPAAYQALCERGWSACYLGPLDAGLSGQARRGFASPRVVAVLDHAAVGAGPGDLAVDLCLTGPITFHRTGRARSPLRLGRVLDVVFSEAVRDIELIAAAAADRGQSQAHAAGREGAGPW